MAAILDDHRPFRQVSPSGAGAASAAMPNRADLLRIGLVNNMPDSAVLRDGTAVQPTAAIFGQRRARRGRALRSASRSPSRICQGAYRRKLRSIEALWDDALDGIVVTGTEPLERDLKDEAFWGALAGLIDWVDDRGLPAMFSCLAAHAAVLHADGVPRTKLADKCFGVFEEDVTRHHVLMEGTDARMWMPHTRWNQVTEADLRKAGYDILSRSDDAGVGYFARHRNGLWLLCQGHPEYDGANRCGNTAATSRDFCSTSVRPIRNCPAATSASTTSRHCMPSSRRRWRMAMPHSWPRSRAFCTARRPGMPGG